MPKVGIEVIRRKSLIEATVDAIHERGFCDVTVAQIAKRAGVSPALAHHYFGSKDQLLAATMGHLLKDLSDGVRQRLAKAETPRERISAIIDGNFAPAQFRPSVIAAWLAFYAQARTTRSSQRILRIYSSRLRSNLTFNLRSFMSREQALSVAEGTASIIDGAWIRQALSDGPSDRDTAIAMVEDYVETQIRQHAGENPENGTAGSRKIQ
ncbi:transcriptional regulator BetI [Roseibium litorale]|uniref:HTH-type transcriptional regulator BetI n=1 Tax=Roseibium litorale TaxID=2803841 RepID=A0ABR9CN22_9HYPH|nr:transcriptional regulator BetI [Roseibium litorale]MBD8892246.1 transcriptional regulator BetI [Roseibium litorale]